MPERFLVVGGGAMGAGIALAAAQSGYTVDIVEPAVASRDRAEAYMAREAQRSGDASAMRQIRWVDTISASLDATVAVEAVPERLELKREVFAELSRVLPRHALLATNTSSLAVSDLAEVVDDPSRVLGMHFFNPPTRMQLVEIVRAAQTGDQTLDRAFEIVGRMGKRAVLVADTPGFIVNRVARPYYLQALRALERRIASAEELDLLARGAGFRMGPFELMDFIGLDVNLATSESIYDRTGEERFAPSALQREMVAAGSLGRKTGSGFYVYAGPDAVKARAPSAASQFEQNTEEIVVVLGFGRLAEEFADELRAHYATVVIVENDELLDELPENATIIVDAGDGSSDRGDVIAELDASFGEETIIFADAYATDLDGCVPRLRHPSRVAGYGVIGSLGEQRSIEIVNASATSDDALELGQELFATLGKAVVLIEDAPGLFLGRTIGSIVNEAMIAVAENVATPEDIDDAMRLGANYPFGPIAWGRAIGGARLTRILKRLADAEGDCFAPHRSLWLLDVEEAPAETAQ